MFKRLRNRFLLLHMTIVFLLIGVFFGSVLLLYHQSMGKVMDSRIELAWAAYHNTPQGFVRPGALYVVGDAQVSGLTIRAQSVIGIAITVNDLFEPISIESAYDMDDDFYRAITNQVFSAKEPPNAGTVRTDGVVMQYKREGNEIVFVDIMRETEMFNSLAKSALMIAVPLLVVIFCVSMFFANQAIQPIESTFNRQREFVADASHELKTPLTSIATNLEVLAGLAVPEQQKWIGYIQTETTRMAGLTNSLLYLTKMDMDTARITALASLSQLLDAVLLPLEAVFFEKGLAIETAITPDVMIIGDAVQIRHLIGILVDNAIRYAAHSISITLEKNQSSGTLTVTNDGPGIPADAIDKIWNRFYRCDQARQYNGGYGLGLPMAKSIVERHKGKITCESVVDERTIFTVKLPLAD